MDSGYLPEELVIPILERLPPAAIRRFKSVCKSWCCILSAPGYLERSILLQWKRRETCLAITKRRGDKAAGLIDPSSCSTTELQPLPRRPEELGRLLVVGSCRGIVCLADRDKSKWCALWNPTTGESTVLPEHVRYPRKDGWQQLACSFGFGHHDGNWKVVKIVEEWHDYNVRYWTWMYEMGSDSWKKISPIGIKSQFYVSCDYDSKRTVACWRDGRMCSWIGLSGIVSFDMANKAFTSNGFPDCLVPRFCSLLTLNDLLALSCFRSCWLPQSEFSDIWVLLKHDVQESWTKLWSIQYGPDPHLALEIWNGGLVWNKQTEDRLQWYDLSNSQVKTLPVAYKSGSSEVVAFEKTHASIANIGKKVQKILEPQVRKSDYARIEHY